MRESGRAATRRSLPLMTHPGHHTASHMGALEPFDVCVVQNTSVPSLLSANHSFWLGIGLGMKQLMPVQLV
jgi:hypothetical protein